MILSNDGEDTHIQPSAAETALKEMILEASKRSTVFAEKIAYWAKKTGQVDAEWLLVQLKRVFNEPEFKTYLLKITE